MFERIFQSKTDNATMKLCLEWNYHKTTKNAILTRLEAAMNAQWWAIDRQEKVIIFKYNSSHTYGKLRFPFFRRHIITAHNVFLDIYCLASNVSFISVYVLALVPPTIASKNKGKVNIINEANGNPQTLVTGQIARLLQLPSIKPGVNRELLGGSHNQR